MDKTCCPQYSIKCDAVNFKLSKSHKKVLKRVNKFLSSGVKPGDQADVDGLEGLEEGAACSDVPSDRLMGASESLAADVSQGVAVMSPVTAGPGSTSKPIASINSEDGPTMPCISSVAVKESGRGNDPTEHQPLVSPRHISKSPRQGNALSKYPNHVTSYYVQAMCTSLCPMGQSLC